MKKFFRFIALLLCAVIVFFVGAYVLIYLHPCGYFLCVVAPSFVLYGVGDFILNN